MSQPETTIRILSTRLEHRRKALRLSVKELSELAGLDKNTVGRVLRGGASATVKSVTSIEAAIAQQEVSLHRHLAAIFEPQREAAE